MASVTPKTPKPSVFDRPENFINRELSWLEFNARVLQEAIDPTQPLLERVRFLSIVGTNLDEFFEVRVAGLKQQIESKSVYVGADHMTASEVFAAASKRARELVAAQYRCWNDDIVPALNKEGIYIHDVDKLPASALNWTEKVFSEELFPTLTPLAVDPSHPFPQLLNKSHNLIVQLARADNSDTLTAVVQIPRVLPRLLLVPEEPARELGPGLHYFFLQDLVKHYLSRLFAGWEVRDAHAFRMTRNSDLYIDEEEAENLLHTIEEELRRLNKGNATRLEVQAGTPPEVEKFLLENFRLTEADLYRLPGPINFLHLEPLFYSDAFPKLRDRPFQPVFGKAVPHGADIFEVMRKGDVLLHHPYESFQSVVELLERAAVDPQVLAIKMTLYRTGDALGHRAGAPARGGQGQAGDGARGTEGAFRRGQQHPLGAADGGGGRARRVWVGRAEDPLQDDDDRAPRRGPHPALHASRHGQLQRHDGAFLHRPEPADDRAGIDGGGGRRFQ